MPLVRPISFLERQAEAVGEPHAPPALGHHVADVAVVRSRGRLEHRAVVLPFVGDVRMDGLIKDGESVSMMQAFSF